MGHRHGASDRIVCSVSMFTKITSITQCVVELLNDETVNVTHIGTIQLSAHFTLENVLCVPSFSFNLLSVNKITHQLPFCLVFLSQFCLIQDLTCWRTIGVVEMHHGLYLLQRKTTFRKPKFPPSLTECLSQLKPFNSAVNSVLDMSRLWHFRSGHPSCNKMLPLKDVLPSFSNNCDTVVLFVLWQNRRDCLSLFIMTFPVPLLILCILMFGSLFSCYS